MTTNHPAHGPVSLDRLHQIREHLQHDTQYSNGGNRAYILADMLKVIDEALTASNTQPVAWTDAEELRDLERDGCGAMLSLNRKDCEHADPRRQILLFTHPAPLRNAEREELQELRRNYLALRGEIEDVQSQLYEEENQANEYASELQERRKADSAEPIYQYRIRNGYNGQVTEWQTIRRDQVDFVLKAQPLNAEFRIISAPQPAPVVPSEMPDDCGFKDSYIDGWNACRAAMLKAAPKQENI